MITSSLYQGWEIWDKFSSTSCSSLASLPTHQQGLTPAKPSPLCLSLHGDLSSEELRDFPRAPSAPPALVQDPESMIQQNQAAKRTFPQ